MKTRHGLAAAVAVAGMGLLGGLLPTTAHADFTLVGVYSTPNEGGTTGVGAYMSYNGCGSSSHVDSSTAPNPYPEDDPGAEDGYDGGLNKSFGNIVGLRYNVWAWSGDDFSGTWEFGETGGVYGNVAASVPTTSQQPYGSDNASGFSDSSNGVNNGGCHAECGFHHNSIVGNAFYATDSDAGVDFEMGEYVRGYIAEFGFSWGKYIGAGSSVTTGKAGSATAISSAYLNFSTPFRLPDPPPIDKFI